MKPPEIRRKSEPAGRLSQWIAYATLAVVLAISVPRTAAQPYSINWHKISGGGGTSANGQYSVSGTVGQHDASITPMVSGNFSLNGGFWALYALPTPGAPTLFITHSGNQAILYWPAGAAGYLLENNNNLAVSSWSSVSPAPNLVNGTNYVTNSISPGNNYYRLHHP